MKLAELNNCLHGCFSEPWKVDEIFYRRESTIFTHVYRIVNDRGEGAALKMVGIHPNRKERALMEVDIARSLEGCPHVVSAHEFCLVERQKRAYLLFRMDLLTSLRAVSDECDLSPDEVVVLGISIAKALEACHKIEITHKDVKPENIFMADNGIWKLGDFGISRIQKEGELTSVTAKGECTPIYAAPEVLTAEDANSKRGDIYSLGLVLYQLLNDNMLPYAHCGLDQVLEKRLTEPEAPRLTGCDRKLADSIHRMLFRDPEERYSSASEVIKDLSALLQGSGTATTGFHSRLRNMETMPSDQSQSRPPEPAAAPAQAPDDEDGRHYNWFRLDDEIHIFKCVLDDRAGQHVRIPAELGGKQVAVLGGGLFLEHTEDGVEEDGEKSLAEQENEKRRKLLREVTIPASVKSIDCTTFFGCIGLQAIHVDPDNRHYKDIDGVLFTKDGKKLVYWPAGRKVETYEIPGTTTEIGDCAFALAKLRKVRFPAGLKRIGICAFSGCENFTGPIIPAGCAEIDNEAFTHCPALMYISVPSSVTRIGVHILSGRYFPQVLCEKDSSVDRYARECHLNRKHIVLTDGMEDLMNKTMVVFDFACKRHPQSIPRTSGSYALVMKAGEALLGVGGVEFVSLALSLFAATNPERAFELAKVIAAD